MTVKTAKKASAAGASADVSNRCIYPKNKNVVPKVVPKEKRKTRKNDKMTKEKPAARGYARKKARRWAQCAGRICNKWINGTCGLVGCYVERHIFIVS